MSAEKNWYSGLLFFVGCVSFVEAVVNFSIDYWICYLVILGFVVVMDLFPLKLPNGIEYAAGSIGCLLVLFKYGLATCIVTFTISMLFAFYKKFKFSHSIYWYRYGVTIGIYSVSFLISEQIISLTGHLHIIYQVFLAALIFELVNHLLLTGMKKTVHGQQPEKSFTKDLVMLLYPVMVYTFLLPRFLQIQDSHQWIIEVVITGIIGLMMFNFSFRFSKEIQLRKNTEAALQKAQQDLLDTIRYQQGMTFKFKEINGRFIHTMNDGELVYRMGTTPDHIIGKELTEFLPLDLARKKEQFYRQAWQGAENVIYEGEINGITYIASLRPIKRDGKVVEVIASCVDITERKKTEELLLKSEKLAVAGQLAAGLAHEVRNPLTTVRGMVQLLQAGRVKEEYFDLLISEIDRMNYIIKEFLVLAKPYPVEFKQINIHSLLHKVVTLFEAESHLKNIQINLNFTSDQSTIMGDENQLIQVFINIIKNAFESMPDGGAIYLQTWFDSLNQFIVSVTDTGCGIPAERLNKLGEPFYSTKEKGTGLGLMVTFKIIQEHKGTIHIESEISKGTKVQIKLPVNVPALLQEAQ